MTLLHGLRSRLYFFVGMGLAIGTTVAGCEHANKQQAAPGVAVGGSATTLPGSGGATAVGSGGSTGLPTGGATSTDSGSGGSVDGNGGSASINTTSTGGTTTITTCVSDLDCKAQRQLCDTTANKCVECLQNVDCAGGIACVGGVCGGAAGCKANADCAASADGKVCDAARGRCVACVMAADCPNPTTSDCVVNACVAVAVCTNSLDCTNAATSICNRTVTPARCVQCTTNADCVSGGAGQVCAGNACHPSCSTNSDCTNGLKCNNSVVPNFCATCATSTDCAAAQFCSKGACVADICAGGADQSCINNGVATCSPDGDGFGAPQACPSGQTCSVTASRATCANGTTTTTTTTTTTSCSSDPGTVNTCAKIPAFNGTQVVDGKGDDFCDIASFELNFKNAAAVNNNKVTGGSTASFTQRALAKVAWSADAFHAFIEVFGTPVRSNTTVDKPWDGDSIELMVTTASSATGLTSKDANSLHIIANYGVAVTVKSDGSAGTHTAITDSSQFKGIQSSTGYIVELKLPWPGAPSLASATAMRFDLAMNIDSASVDPTVQGRDAQAVLAMTAISGTTTCSSPPATPFCDDRVWCPTALE